MQFIKKLDENLEEYLLVYSIAFAVVIVFIQVVMRYVFHSSLSWSEELARYLFVWQIWLGACYAVKKDKHIRIVLVKDKLSAKHQKIMEYIVLLVWLSFSLFLTVKSYDLVQYVGKVGQLSPALRIPIIYPYYSVLVGWGLMSFRVIQKIIENHNSCNGKESQ